MLLPLRKNQLLNRLHGPRRTCLRTTASLLEPRPPFAFIAEQILVPGFPADPKVAAKLADRKTSGPGQYGKSLFLGHSIGNFPRHNADQNVLPMSSDKLLPMSSDRTIRLTFFRDRKTRRCGCGRSR